MNDYDFDGCDDFSVYNDETVHNMYVDEFYNAGGCCADNVIPDEDNPAPLVDISAVPPRLRTFIDDCANVDVARLVNDCMRRCGYYDD